MEKFQELIENAQKYRYTLISAEYELKKLVEEAIRNTPITLISVQIEYNTRLPLFYPFRVYPRAIVSYTIGNDGCGYADLERLFDNLGDIPQIETALDMEKVLKTIKLGNSPTDPAVRTLQFNVIPQIKEDIPQHVDDFLQEEHPNEDDQHNEETLYEESEESKAAYEYLKSVQEQMDAEQPSVEEDYQNEEFSYRMLQPINTKSRVLKTIVTSNKESNNTNSSEPINIEDDTIKKNEEILQEEENQWNDFLKRTNNYIFLTGSELQIRIVQECKTTIPQEEAIPIVMGNLTYSEKGRAEKQLVFKYLKSLLCEKIEEFITLYNEYKEKNKELSSKLQKIEDKTLQPESDIVELYTPSYSNYDGYNDERVNVDTDIVLMEDDNEIDERLQDVKVYQTRWNNEYYFVRANIMGDNYYAELTNEHTEKYLERDENGVFTRKITPMMLAKAYFNKVLKEYETTEHGDVIKIGSKVQWNKGFGAVFEKSNTENIKVDEKLVSMVQTANPCIIQYMGERYIDATINGIHKTEKLDENDKSLYELHPANAGYINPLHMFLKYFVHELPFLQKGIVMEQESNFLQGGNKVNGNIILTEQNRKDYSQIKLPEGYILENPRLSKYNNKYSIDVTLKGGIIKKSTSIWMKREGKHISSYLTEDEIANLLERNENGNFTRRVSAKDIATERVLPIIEEMEDVYNMHCAGIPAKIIEEVMCWTEGELKSFLKDFSFQRNKYISTAFLRKKDNDKIRNDYEDGCSLSTRRKKYKFKDYAILYAVLKDKINSQNPVLPDDIGIGQITMESSKPLEQDD